MRAGFKYLSHHLLLQRVRASSASYRVQESALSLHESAPITPAPSACAASVAYDLGLQLAEGGWPNASSFLKDVCDPDFLKVMLEAVADSVRRSTGLERGSHTEYEEAE